MDNITAKEEHVTIIQEIHKKLKLKYNNTSHSKDFAKVWKEHCEDETIMLQYANAMCKLAMEWSVNPDGMDRINWCQKEIRWYFTGGGLSSIQNKDERRKQHFEKNPQLYHCGPNIETESTENSSSTDNQSISLTSAKIRLLDVGSCYNPFVIYNEFETVAIDIAPANKGVKKCDFMTVKISDDDGGVVYNDKDSVEVFQTNYFHVVVFSLLLSYIPSPAARWEMCHKAYQVLQTDGLLIIITPDSNPQNKSTTLLIHWRIIFETMGFQRIKYVKDTHMHFLIFRKVPCNHIWDRRKEILKNQSIKNQINSNHRIPSAITKEAKVVYLPKDFSSNHDTAVESSSNNENIDISWDVFPFTS